MKTEINVGTTWTRELIKLSSGDPICVWTVTSHSVHHYDSQQFGYTICGLRCPTAQRADITTVDCPDCRKQLAELGLLETE